MFIVMYISTNLMYSCFFLDYGTHVKYYCPTGILVNAAVCVTQPSVVCSNIQVPIDGSSYIGCII